MTFELEKVRADFPILSEKIHGHRLVYLDSGASAELDALAAWADQTRDGSTADLLVAPRTDVWDEVAAEPDLCTRLRCPHFEQCFVFHARKLAAQADIVVVNHHLLMADVAVRRASGKWAESAVLPAYSRLVIDEGHHLEDAASSHLGQTVTRRGVQRLFARLDRNGKGLLHSLERKLVAADDLLSIASLDLVRARLVPAATTARRSYPSAPRSSRSHLTRCEVTCGRASKIGRASCRERV